MSFKLKKLHKHQICIFMNTWNHKEIAFSFLKILILCHMDWETELGTARERGCAE